MDVPFTDLRMACVDAYPPEIRAVRARNEFQHPRMKPRWGSQAHPNELDSTAKNAKYAKR